MSSVCAESTDAGRCSAGLSGTQAGKQKTVCQEAGSAPVLFPSALPGVS